MDHPVAMKPISNCDGFAVAMYGGVKVCLTCYQDVGEAHIGSCSLSHVIRPPETTFELRRRAAVARAVDDLKREFGLDQYRSSV